MICAAGPSSSPAPVTPMSSPRPTPVRLAIRCRIAWTALATASGINSPRRSAVLIVDTFGSDFDTGLAIYTGACDALTEVACNDDTDGVTSQVTIPTTAGTTYSILVGGYGSDAGNLVLHLNYLTPPAFVIQPTNEAVI